MSADIDLLPDVFTRVYASRMPAPTNCGALIERGNRRCGRGADVLIDAIPLCFQHGGQLVRDIRQAMSGAVDQYACRHVCTPETVRAQHESESVIYYLRRSDDLIKIGFSCRLARRISSLAAIHGPLELLASHAGYRAAERVLHRRFADDRVEGEWFLPSDELLAHITFVNRRAEKRAS